VGRSSKDSLRLTPHEKKSLGFGYSLISPPTLGTCFFAEIGKASKTINFEDIELKFFLVQIFFQWLLAGVCAFRRHDPWVALGSFKFPHRPF